MAQRGTTVGDTDFPLYAVKALGERHILVAGGGGKAKTGIKNAFEIFDIQPDGKSYRLKKVKSYETGSQAIMNGAVIPKDNNGKQFTFAAGMDGECKLFDLHSHVVTPKTDGQVTEGIRKRKGNLTVSSEHEAASKMVTFDVDPLESVETDFDKEGGFQKAVAFTKDKAVMVTGGADGHLRTWQCPSLKMLYEVKAHSGEIDDLDVSDAGNRIVTVSRDGKAFVWNTKDGSKKDELHFTKKTDTKYRFRHCRFSVVSDKKDACSLFTSHVPAASGGGKKVQPCYITKWDAKAFTSSRVQATGPDMLSALTVNETGVYLGVGTVTGSVSVYIAFSLQKLYEVKQSHNIFVTGLAFSPTLPGSPLAAYDFSMFSISVDKQIKLHQVSPRTLWSPLWAIAGFIIIIYSLFWMLVTSEL